MLTMDFIDGSYPDFIHRLDDFLELVPSGHAKCSKNDILFLYSIIYSKKPENVLEIGRSYGTSTLTICGALTDNNKGKLYSIDVENLLPKDIANIIDKRTQLITNSSEYLLDEINDVKFGVTFIDGDHSYEMAKNDIIKSMTLSEDEAIILCHDSDMLGVQQAINEVCGMYPTSLLNCGVFGEKIQMLIVRK